MAFTDGVTDRMSDQPLSGPLGVGARANRQSVKRPVTRSRPAVKAASKRNRVQRVSVQVGREGLDCVASDRLASTHRLSAYYAAYLDLALRRSQTLLSLDARLVTAARALGNPVRSSVPEGCDPSGR